MRERVLVVDDEPAICRALSRELRLDFNAVSVLDAESALGLWEPTDPPIAVVSDLTLGIGADGISFLAEVKRRAPRVARILVSASSDLARIDQALKVETVHEFLPKPWPAGEVLAAVRRWVAALQTQVSRSGTLPLTPMLGKKRARRSSG